MIFDQIERVSYLSTRIMGLVGGGTLAIQAVHGLSYCSTERPPT